MTLSKEAARTVAALVNVPFDDVLAEQGQARIYPKMLNGHVFHQDSILRGIIRLNMRAQNPIGGEKGADIWVNPEGLVKISASMYDSTDFMPLQQALDELIARWNRIAKNRKMPRHVGVMMALCREALDRLAKMATSAA